MSAKMTKKEAKALSEKLFRQRRPVWDRLSASEEKHAFAFAERYRHFLDAAKTERRAAAAVVGELEKNGFENIKTASARKKKVYQIYHDKAVAAAVIGERPLAAGINLLAAHIDSPRLDLKQNPLYEEVGLSLFKAHYYGGIRKYQWLSRPLALYGRIIKQDGSAVDIALGDGEGDPVFTIADLLPHLARKLQANKKLADVFDGEKMNLLAGSRPTGDQSIKERFKLTVLRELFNAYGIVEEDFVSAELEAVPAGRARDVGLDRSLIGAYGQDDRICAYTSLQALIATKQPRRTAVVMFYDKEEIGSEGNSGAKSRLLEGFVSDLLDLSGQATDERTLRKALAATRALSADVNGALDPDYQEVHEKNNAAQLGYGVCITKFTGSGGKSGSSDASAEYVGWVRQLFNAAGVAWQTGELGRVDQGGGGTIAKFLAEYGMDILDCGPALLGMHSPFEISSKGDIYMTRNAYQAFLEAV
ncbi:MAG: aminopeptidase [Desulfosudaceae bacterium]